MKKLFTFVACALMSVAMLAGENDLLWDFTEAAPSSSPVAAQNNPNVNLTYGSAVNDGPGKNNGLYGIKLNSSGYCYFTKAAVAGKLKLSYGPRSGQNKASLEIFTWEGETAAATTSIATTSEVTELQTVVVELTEGQNNIYIKRLLNTETVLTKIEFLENVARTFVDFKIEFRDNPYTVLLPENGELPAGVKVEGTSYNGGQHGIYGGKITVPVDGPVKFTIGACQYSGSPITIKKDGEKLLDFSNNAPCGEQKPNYAQFVTYTYTGEAGTLTFELAGNTYVPYFFAEACEVTPCEIIFKDQNGAVLGKVETIEGAKLEEIPYTVADLPAFDGDTHKFRGWFYTSGKKAVVGDVINGNTTIQAKVTPIEEATVGSVQVYDFTNPYFYPEDHETIEVIGGYYHDGQHGWAFKNGEGFGVQVAGNAVIVLDICQYGTAGATWSTLYEGGESPITPTEVPAIGSDGEQVSFRMAISQKAAAVFTLLNTGGENYLHKVTVYNVENFLEKDETTGYFMVPAGDAASFILALAQAESGDKIFLPNGMYDLGETVLTTISKNNIAIIGQSMEGTIIKNAPDYKTESIDKTATIRIAKNVSGTYLQDLTLRNALDYYKNNNGRAVALWDQGTKTVCKNVRLLSYQDTYYSNLIGAVKYFEDCEIHGTVDFICGDGSVYFKNNLLYCEKRSTSGGGSDALTANNGDASDRGYVFEGCTLKSECPVVSFGRAWNNTPSTTLLNTLVDYSAGEFRFSDDAGKIQRWTKELMNANAWPRFGEYNTHLADGTVLTPESNIVKFVDTKTGNATKDIETVLSTEEAAAFTIEYTLGDWAATAAADATQAVCEEQWEDLEADAVYMAESDGSFIMLLKGSEVMNRLALYDGVVYTLRKANARGGFGPRAGEPSEGIENTPVSNSQVEKIIRNGQLVIVRDQKAYNVLGAEL